jgi:FkbM family methyltransferase
VRLSLLYNPFDLIERLGIEIGRKRRLKKLQHTPARELEIGHIDSLELLELIKTDLMGGGAPVIFDIGGNIGTWTLLATAILPNSTVHAFEPLQVHIDGFKKNTAQLRNIYLHEYCVGNTDQEGTINISSFSDSSSLLNATPLEYNEYQIVKINEEKVQIKRLESLIEKSILPVPDIIKLDIQGYELEALKGLGKYLEFVKYIICEVSFQSYYYQQPLFLDVANYLEQFEFNILAFGNGTAVGKTLGQADVLFKRH